MKQCPRCRRACLADEKVLNSLAHQDGKTEICSTCGNMEGLVKLGGNVPESEVHLTMEFERYLKEKK